MNTVSRNWTEAQKDAINAKGGNVLVSAAAGSGKTAVLVERVTRRIVDRENPVRADRFLIVTFTRAAAGEMRERIDAAINALIAKNPADSWLINQKMLLSSAKICTIDSFCSSLVRENFSELDLAPDFKTADEGELSVLSLEAADMTMEELYNRKDKSFRDLVELLFAGRDDSRLSECIMSLYKSSRSFPFPESWLDSLAADFDSCGDLKNSRHGEVLFNYAKTLCEYSLSITRGALREIAGDPDLEKMLFDALTSDAAQYEYILSFINGKCWDDAKRGAENFKAARRGNTPKHLREDPFTLSLVEKRKVATKNIEDLAKVFCCREEDFYSDCEFFAPIVKSLVEAAKLYGKNLALIKKRKKLADFDDITHAALRLLVKETPDGWERTRQAESLSAFYEEILIDEYQDTNKAQDMLFTAISRKNLFRVGDVKQSIYSFRQAMPKIFIELKNAYKPYDRDEGNFPAKILLGNNFRSRRGVTDIINFVFSQLMSSESGDIEYNSEEELVPLAAYSEKSEAATELHLLDTTENTDEADNDTLQAAYIADRIIEMVEGGCTVKDGDGERRVSYGDFAVLLRSVSKKAQIYADVFRGKGIPCFTETGGTFLKAKEISLVLNFLRVIDNPKQDVPLISVLMSPVFGFSLDEVSLIRLKGKGDFYSCLLASANEGEEKSKAFLAAVSRWRNLAACLPASELITEIYNETGIVSVFDAADRSGLKRANLMLLYDYACVYEKSGYSGLSSFIRFIDRLSSQKQDLTGALGEIQSADVVKIMTIHKSKGLEFPVCILSDCMKKFNRMDETKNLIVNLKHGLGIVRRDLETFEQYRTVCHSAVKLSMHRDSVSEELRVLYVAMTRAKEKLIMVMAKDKPEDLLRKCSIDINLKGQRLTPYAVTKAGSYGNWLLTCLLRHPDSRELRKLADIPESVVIGCTSPLRVVVHKPRADAPEPEKKAFTAEADDTVLGEIESRLSYRYPYEALTGVITKRAASEVDRNYIDRDYFASSVPSFLTEGGLNGAQRGIATHTFIQFADYEKACADLEAEIERLTARGILSAVQAKGINRSAIRSFFESGLFGRILRSPLVMREKKFTLEVPVGDVYPELSDFSSEKMMIQGIADCAFLEDGELVVVDYKTDRLQNETDFVVKYASQVLLYKKALAECTGYGVKSAVLYSFHLGKEIEVE